MPEGSETQIHQHFSLKFVHNVVWEPSHHPLLLLYPDAFIETTKARIYWIFQRDQAARLNSN